MSRRKQQIKRTLTIVTTFFGSLILALPAFAQIQPNGQPGNQPLSDRYNQNNNSVVSPSSGDINSQPSNQPLSDRYNQTDNNNNVVAPSSGQVSNSCLQANRITEKPFAARFLQPPYDAAYDAQFRAQQQQNLVACNPNSGQQVSSNNANNRLIAGNPNQGSDVSQSIGVGREQTQQSQQSQQIDWSQTNYNNVESYGRPVQYSQPLSSRYQLSPNLAIAESAQPSYRSDRMEGDMAAQQQQPLASRYNSSMNNQMSASVGSDQTQANMPMPVQQNEPLANRYNMSSDQSVIGGDRTELSSNDQQPSTISGSAAVPNSNQVTVNPVTPGSSTQISEQPQTTTPENQTTGVTQPAPEQLQSPTARITTSNGLVQVRLINNTGAPVAYQVIGDTTERSLDASGNVTLQSLKTPTTITFQRPDGGLIEVNTSSASQAGMLEVTLNPTTDLNADKKNVRIQASGDVFLY